MKNLTIGICKEFVIKALLVQIDITINQTKLVFFGAPSKYQKIKIIQYFKGFEVILSHRRQVNRNFYQELIQTYQRRNAR